MKILALAWSPKIIKVELRFMIEKLESELISIFYIKKKKWDLRIKQEVAVSLLHCVGGTISCN